MKNFITKHIDPKDFKQSMNKIVNENENLRKNEIAEFLKEYKSKDPATSSNFQSNK